jgi:mono/diheme cytochrome c family protein
LRLTIVLCAAFFAVAAGFALAQAPKTVTEGAYTEAQATRGQAVYDRNCSRCHGAALDGGGAAPPLRTHVFLDAWREDFLSSLFLHIQTRMPPGSLAGSLSEAQYVDIVAYILQVNELPAGKSELTRAALDMTLLTAPSGPQPIPDPATVRTAGCFTHSGDAWSITQALPPARVRNGGETDPAELERSARAQPGTRTIRLVNLEDDHSEAELLKRAGQRMQVKGVLSGEGTGARIYVLSFEPLNQPCGG